MGTPQDSADRSWSDRGGYVTGFEQVFDPSGFEIPAQEVQSLDPLFHWLLHTGRQALAEVQQVSLKRAGVVIGNWDSRPSP